jgi:hypothetical protein
MKAMAASENPRMELPVKTPDYSRLTIVTMNECWKSKKQKEQSMIKGSSPRDSARSGFAFNDAA